MTMTVASCLFKTEAVGAEGVEVGDGLRETGLSNREAGPSKLGRGVGALAVAY